MHLCDLAAAQTPVKPKAHSAIIWPLTAFQNALAGGSWPGSAAWGHADRQPRGFLLVALQAQQGMHQYALLKHSLCECFCANVIDSATATPYTCAAIRSRISSYARQVLPTIPQQDGLGLLSHCGGEQAV